MRFKRHMELEHGLKQIDIAPLIDMVLERLERVSADSALAHQASGIRGGLLNFLEAQELGRPLQNRALDGILEQAFTILEQEAARYSSPFGGIPEGS